MAHVINGPAEANGQAPSGGSAVQHGNGHSRLHTEFVRAVRNSVAHAKRSLLDFVDFQRETLPAELQDDPRVRSLFEFFKRRVHNDVSMIESQVLAAFEICRSGGEIPPFGRTEREAAPVRARDMAPANGRRG